MNNDTNRLPTALPPTPISFDWVKIPAGKFIMGSDQSKDKDAFEDELPQFELSLLEYWIAKIPVTVAQFGQFVKATNYKTTAESEGKAYIYHESEWTWVEGADWLHPFGPQSDVAQKTNHPVVYISWADAIAFCHWANVRLPTEAEWEKAARGDDGRIYPWGNEVLDSSRCNFAWHENDTTPVYRYPEGASPYGCLDMVGNVWEWTSTKWLDGYVDYEKQVDDHLDSDDLRVVRGGAFQLNHRVARCAARFNNVYWNAIVGLRVVWSPGNG